MEQNYTLDDFTYVVSPNGPQEDTIMLENVEIMTNLKKQHPSTYSMLRGILEAYSDETLNITIIKTHSFQRRLCKKLREYDDTIKNKNTDLQKTLEFYKEAGIDLSSYDDDGNVENQTKKIMELNLVKDDLHVALQVVEIILKRLFEEEDKDDQPIENVKVGIK